MLSLALLALWALPRPDTQVVYSRYQDGRPRLVVVARYLSFNDGEVLLMRFPDRAGAKGTIVDRYDPDGGAVAVWLFALVDRKDVVVEVSQNHPPGRRVLRVRGDELVEIADDLASSANTPDLDGDGIPEIVWSATPAARHVPAQKSRPASSDGTASATPTTGGTMPRWRTTATPSSCARMESPARRLGRCSSRSGDSC